MRLPQPAVPLGEGPIANQQNLFSISQMNEAKCMLKKTGRGCKVPPKLMGLFGHCLLPYAVRINLFRLLQGGS
jgi:hypothetical protein